MDYLDRIAKLTTLLQDKGCQAMVVDNPLDIFYLTGIELSLGRLIVAKERVPTLFVDGRYYERCRQVSFIEVVLVEDGALEQLLAKMGKGSWQTLAFDSAYTTFKGYLDLQNLIAKAGVDINLQPLDAPIKFIRRIKEPEEIELLKKAAELGSEGFDYVCSILQEGITELEVANELEIFWKLRGAKALAFESIIAFGVNSSMPHYRPGPVPLRKGDVVLIDIGVNVDHYHSDMTRCVFFGPPQPFIQEQYLAVKEAQESALAMCRPGVLIKDVDAAARKLLPPERFMHGLGHGVGLEIHESPILNYKHPDKDICLEEGMVITIEPGVYYPGVGGIRIEDTIVITANGYEDLTKRPKTIKVIWLR